MKLLATIALLASCLGAFAQPRVVVSKATPEDAAQFASDKVPFVTTNTYLEPALALVNLTTNRYTNFLATLRVEPILTPCPECGQANHHERRIEHVEVYDLVTATLVSGGQTSVARVYQSPRTAAVVTNVVLRLQPRRQPGWTNAPVPMP